MYVFIHNVLYLQLYVLPWAVIFFSLMAFDVILDLYALQF
jgi:hypothetical protein